METVKIHTLHSIDSLIHSLKRQLITCPPQMVNCRPYIMCLWRSKLAPDVGRNWPPLWKFALDVNRPRPYIMCLWRSKLAPDVGRNWPPLWKFAPDVGPAPMWVQHIYLNKNLQNCSMSTTNQTYFAQMTTFVGWHCNPNFKLAFEFVFLLLVFCVLDYIIILHT